MDFRLKAQRYDGRHFVAILFRCEPLGTVVLGVQKLLTALSNVFQVLAVAEFLDRAFLAAKGELDPIRVISTSSRY
jgi:hypothetical protein